MIKNRSSIRSFKSKPVESYKLERILESAISAPSAGNLQAYKIMIVENDDVKYELAKASFGQMFVKEAPIVLVFFANPKISSQRYGKRGESLYCIQDATISASFAHLTATALGLGSVWVGAFEKERVKDILKEKDMVPIAILPIGYPDEKPKTTPKKSIMELCRFVK